MNSKSFKKLIFFNIILIIIFIILAFFISNYIYKETTNKIISNNAYILNNIIKKYPDLEVELVEIILSNENNIKNGYDVLAKYGLNEYQNFDNIYNKNHFKNKIYNLIFYLVISILITIPSIYLYYLRYNSKKIKKINKYMYNILNGDYSLDIREYNEGEINILKNDIYKITTILKEQSEKSHQDKLYLESVLTDISHQIKTPLTSMYVINDLLSNDNIDPAIKKNFLGKNKKQLERIEWLVTSLLKMSRLDSGSIILKKEKINIKKLIEDAIEPIKIPSEIKNQKIINKANDAYIKADYNWTLEALVNILKNACEHTKDNGEIIIDVIDNSIFLEIIIKDNGEGISAYDLPYIFDRFYKSKKDNNESIGIGLNMAKKIINKQNGEIIVKSKENVGTTFIIKMYKKII